MKCIKIVIGLLFVIQILQTISTVCLIKVKEENDKKFRALSEALYVGITKEKFDEQNGTYERKLSALESVKKYYYYMGVTR